MLYLITLQIEMGVVFLVDFKAFKDFFIYNVLQDSEMLIKYQNNCSKRVEKTFFLYDKNLRFMECLKLD